MAKNATMPVPANDWAEGTDADSTNVTFQNVGGGPLLVLATVGSVKPTSDDGAIRYWPGQGELNVVLTELFPGVAGANRIWFKAGETPGSAQVSHA